MSKPISVSRFAKKLGFSRQYIHRMIQDGRIIPRPTRAQALDGQWLYRIAATARIAPVKKS